MHKATVSLTCSMVALLYFSARSASSGYVSKLTELLRTRSHSSCSSVMLYMSWGDASQNGACQRDLVSSLLTKLVFMLSLVTPQSTHLAQYGVRGCFRNYALCCAFVQPSCACVVLPFNVEHGDCMAESPSIAWLEQQCRQQFQG